MNPSLEQPGDNFTVTIQVLDGSDRGRVFSRLSVPLTIGRQETNLVCLNDRRVSGCHAKVLLEGEDLVLTDMKSTNGTRVNGKFVQVLRLGFGDRIKVGKSVLLITFPATSM
ncbi:MAG TPA: FHA domain-containing protein [Gemmataceae bacterium]|jgi:pSer/pThr/pTyr-binding forkhead associated (FHA) protein|nr:FHA domain-containing protein [Gemmataceae bacterium]